MKPIRNILILVGVIAVLSGGFYFVSRYEPVSDNPNAMPTLAPSITILKTERESICKITVTINDESYTLLKKNEQWVVEQDAGIKLDASKLSTLLYNCATVSVKEIIEENARDLSVYGLDAPHRRVSIETTDGRVMTVLIGHTSLNDSVCYLMLEGENTVYSKNSSGCDSLAVSLSSLVSNAIFTMTPEELGGFTITRPGTEKIKVVKELIKESEEGHVYEWRMEAPLVKVANEYNINNQVIDSIITLVAQDMIPIPETGKDYGFSQPRAEYSIWSLDDTRHYTVIVGNQEGGKTYVKLKNENMVYLVATESLPFIEMGYQQFVDISIHLEKITDVAEINLTGMGKTYQMTISGTGDDAVYTINGKTIEESKFKTAYQAVIGLSLNSFTKEPVTGSAEFTICYKKKDGSKTTIECIGYDDRNFVVKVNGKGNLIIRRKQVDNMINQLEKTIAE